MDPEALVECYRLGYDNAAKLALKLSVEVSEQKARADRAESSALERAAQICRSMADTINATPRVSQFEALLTAAIRIERLIPPAAAPAAEVPIRTVPMMPVDEAADARIDALRAAQPRETSRPIAPAAEAGKAINQCDGCRNGFPFSVDGRYHQYPESGRTYQACTRDRYEGTTPAPAQELEVRIAELEAAIRWALGEEGEFRGRETGEGAFWWRIELRHRAKLAARAAPPEVPK